MIVFMMTVVATGVIIINEELRSNKENCRHLQLLTVMTASTIHALS